MNVILHSIVGILGGSIFYLITNSSEGAILAAIGAIFIDLDHAYEYYLYRQRYPSSSFKDFISACLAVELPQIYLFLHSYELLILLTFIFYFLVPYLLPLLWGMSLHLLLDLKANPLHWYSYFFLYRLKVKFDTSLLR